MTKKKLGENVAAKIHLDYAFQIQYLLSSFYEVTINNPYSKGPPPESMHVWSRNVSSFQRSRSDSEWFDSPTKLNWVSNGPEYTKAICLSVLTDKN
jgi:hypothetical protein